MKKLYLAAVAAVALAAPAQAADCPPATVADPMGVAAGAFPQQYELAEFQSAASCTLAFKENPAIGDLNGRIQGNPSLPPVAERLPEEPLVVVPYDEIGRYGGTLDVLSNATEAGTLTTATLAQSLDDAPSLSVAMTQSENRPSS